MSRTWNSRVPIAKNVVIAMHEMHFDVETRSAIPAAAMVQAAHISRGARPLARGNDKSALFWSAKRSMDIVLSGLALVALMPLLAIVAAAVKIQDRGPVFFTQMRVGKGGKEFRLYKFRSMTVERGDVTGVRQTVINDARVTPVGAFIRRTSIDELPQLLNILRGDMSIVGPRPHVKGQLASGRPYAEVVPFYDLRHMVRPGLTGLAQVGGYRGPTHDPVVARKRIEHDLDYISRASLGLDMLIIVRTAWGELFGGTGF